MSIPAFPKILALGTRGTELLYDGPVEITEKLDGSQFSVGKIKNELHMRSKGAIIYAETPPSMFKGAVDWALEYQHLIPNDCIIHGEYFSKPKHNSLEYNGIPSRGFAMFAVRKLPDLFLRHDEISTLADELDCGVIPLLFNDIIDKERLIAKIDMWLDMESSLGGPNMEGIVVKNYNQTGLIGGMILPILCAKYVSEKFKEVHRTGWKKTNPTSMEQIGAQLNTEARWTKAIQYLRDSDELEGSPRDIGPLLKRIQNDIDAEEKENIKDMLWTTFRKQILRMSIRGFPEFYKDYLLNSDSSS